jgi:hypothetical protein
METFLLALAVVLAVLSATAIRYALLARALRKAGR